jgi:hypothetical protein
MTQRRVPSGSKLAEVCRSHSVQARSTACPAKTFSKRKARGTVKPKSFLGKRFMPGTVIDVRVAKRGSSTAVKLVTIRSSSGPSIATRCIPPGKKKPRKRC